MTAITGPNSYMTKKCESCEEPLTSNYWKGRGGYSIKAICLHITDSSFKSAYNTFTNPNSYVSTHYLIGDEIIRMVKDEDSSWGCGRILAPTWPGLEYAQFGTKDLSEYEGSNRGEQGHIIQPVWEKRLTGFRNAVNPNLYTLNVEFAIKNNTFPDFKKWIKWAKFVKELARKHNIPWDRVGLVNHREINHSKSCPGMWNSRSWVKLLNKFFVKV